MTKPTKGEPERALLLVGIIAGREALLDETVRLLEAEFGRVLRVSRDWPFDHTDYYEAESGKGLLRRFVAFAEPVRQERLAELKAAAVRIEREMARRHPDGPPRPVNIDPGLLRLGSLVLASTKISEHRIYLGEGMHAEVTLLYEGGQWKALPWTFPDFRSSRYHDFLSEMREELKAIRKAARNE